MCQILAAIMAYRCNIGPYTTAHLTDGVSYSAIRHITDWQLPVPFIGKNLAGIC